MRGRALITGALARRFKRPEQAPLTACPNCDTLLPTGHWCGACGQNNRRSRLELSELIAHALDELFSIEGRWWTTLKGFFPHFGGMAAEYIEGHRVRYVNPVRLVIVVVALTVAIVSPMSVGLTPAAHSWLVVGGLLAMPVFALLLRAIFSGTGRTLAECVCFALYSYGSSLFLYVLILAYIRGTQWASRWISLDASEWIILSTGLFLAINIGFAVYLGASAARFFERGIFWSSAKMIVAAFATFFLASRAGQVVSSWL
jgi:Protein of unknown function (DUF3667)